MKGTVLLIEKSLYGRRKIKEILIKESFTEFLDISNETQFNLVINNVKDICLIVMDIDFPSETEGIRVLDSIRKIPDLKSIPVIILTDNDKKSVKTETLKYSVYDYIKKPYNDKRLVSSLRSINNKQFDNDSFTYDLDNFDMIKITFEEYIKRELSFAQRMNKELSILLVAEGRDNNSYIKNRNNTDDLFERVFNYAADKFKQNMRISDGVFVKRFSEIIAVMPGTDETGAKEALEKITNNIKNDFGKSGIDFDQYFQTAVSTFPKEGNNFNELMKNTFKKIKAGKIKNKTRNTPINTREYAKNMYNSFRRY
jgi:PleD family two-component response regulator